MVNMNDIKNNKILVVDDNPQNIRVVISILNQHGFSNVLFTTSGQEALDIVNKEEIDLVLLDIMMPEMDGFVVCQILKDNDNTKEIPIIFLTAKAYDKDILKGLQMGAVDYITKPFDNDILYARVKTHLTIRCQAKLLEDENAILEKRINEEVEKRVKLDGKLSALYKESDFGISFISNEGKFIECNDKFAQMLEYEKEEVLRTSPLELTYDEDKKSNEELFNKFVSNVITNDKFIKRCVTKNNKILWFEVLLTRIDCPVNPSEFYVASVCQDITKKVMLEEELKMKEEMLFTQSRQASMGNMIGMIAHQWKQPLSVINLVAGNIQVNIALDEPVDTKELDSEMQLVIDQINYLSQTIDDFKNFFKPNKEKEMIDINDLIDQSIKLIGKNLEKNKIKLTKEYKLTTQKKSYPNELKQVFINLVNNAKDQLVANKIEEPFINISTLEDDENIILHFSDNAGGIPDEYMDKIGEIYFTSKGKEGTGLGLYMSKMIIQKQFNGVISWENNNKGAVFTITIPK